MIQAISIQFVAAHASTTDVFQNVDIDQYAYDALKKFMSSEFQPLLPLKTKGDGNCLVHAACMEEYGREDVDYTKRKELHEFFLQGSIEFKSLWEEQEKRLVAESGFSVDENQMVSEWQLMVDLSSAEISECASRLPLRTLETVHVFGLAQLLKRTIIVIAGKLHYFNGEVYSKERFGGIYLPILNPPENCNKQPIIIGYCHNHFSAMTSSTGEREMLFPLNDCDGNLLPIQYYGFSMSAHEKIQLLKKYLNLQVVKKAKENGSVWCVKYEKLIPEIRSNEINPNQSIENEVDDMDLISPVVNENVHTEPG